MKLTVQRRLEALELRARQKNLDAFPPGYWKKRLMERIEQIRSRIPAEELRGYESEANTEQRQRDREEIWRRLSAWRDARREGAST
jgi:hypothetical protein